MKITYIFSIIIMASFISCNYYSNLNLNNNNSIKKKANNNKIIKQEDKKLQIDKPVMSISMQNNYNINVYKSIASSITKPNIPITPIINDIIDDSDDNHKDILFSPIILKKRESNIFTNENKKSISLIKTIEDESFNEKGEFIFQKKIKEINKSSKYKAPSFKPIFFQF